MTAVVDVSHERLLRALAEQLKLPLLHIARQSELAHLSEDALKALTAITETADMAMQLIDSYLLSTELYSQKALRLEPITISSVLHDTAHKLQHLARQYDCELEISLHGKYEPVVANRESMEAAFTMLGYTFIEAVQPFEGEKKRVVVLAAHRSNRGLVAGIFGNNPGLSSDMFRRARALYGTTRQTLPGIHSSSGAGVFIADSLLAPVATPLRVAQHNKLNGLAATLLPSRQMQLV